MMIRYAIDSFASTYLSRLFFRAEFSEAGLAHNQII